MVLLMDGLRYSCLEGGGHLCHAVFCLDRMINSLCCEPIDVESMHFEQVDLRDLGDGVKASNWSKLVGLIISKHVVVYSSQKLTYISWELVVDLFLYQLNHDPRFDLVDLSPYACSDACDVLRVLDMLDCGLQAHLADDLVVLLMLKFLSAVVVDLKTVMLLLIIVVVRI